MNFPSTFLARLGAVAACITAAIALAACGGYTTVDLGGSVSGLLSDGLILANGGNTVSVPKGATSYSLGQIDAHGDYNVTVKQQPQHYTCAVTNNPGRATGIAINFVNVICSYNTHSVGGTVTNLKGALTLTNGVDVVTLASGGTSFTFAGQIPELGTYGVVVYAQPDTQVCTVANGTGVMGSANVTNIAVTCVDK